MPNLVVMAMNRQHLTDKYHQFILDKPSLLSEYTLPRRVTSAITVDKSTSICSDVDKSLSANHVLLPVSSQLSKYHVSSNKSFSYTLLFHHTHPLFLYLSLFTLFTLNAESRLVAEKKFGILTMYMTTLFVQKLFLHCSIELLRSHFLFYAFFSSSTDGLVSHILFTASIQWQQHVMY